MAVSRCDKDRDRKQANKQKASKLRRARDFAEKHAAEICDLVGRADEIFVQFSWRQRKEMAISAFAKAMECKYSTLAFYLIASFAARVAERTIRDWIKGWKIDEDGVFACDYGTNCARSNLDEPDVKDLAAKWWMDNAPRKGEPFILLNFVTAKTLFLLIFWLIFVCLIAR